MYVWSLHFLDNKQYGFAYIIIMREEVAANLKDDHSQEKQLEERIDVDMPLWNQSTYLGRWRHIAFITDCRTVFVSKEKLWKAKQLCEEYKAGKEAVGTCKKDIVYAKKLRDSAFHPDNGELMHPLGRMSFQLPGSVVLTAAMITFYKSPVGLIGCQIANQSFNAFVNYTNRNASSDDTHDTDMIKQAFLFATTASCGAGFGLRKLLSSKGPVVARFVPFCAVAIGNMINLPIMRQREIKRGIPIYAKEMNTNSIMNSKVAGIKGISECVLTRIIMAAPGMLMIPMISQKMKKHCFYQMRPWIGLPIELSLCTLFLLIMVPSALAIFPQRNSMKSELLKISPEEYEQFKKIYEQKTRPETVYYNKGM